MKHAEQVVANLATALAGRLPRLPVYIIAYLLTGAPRYVAFAMDTPLTALILVLLAGGFGVPLVRLPDRGDFLAMTGSLASAPLDLGEARGVFLQ